VKHNRSTHRNRRDAANGHGAKPRVAIVGAGIFGLAHAWAAARRGWQVMLFERDAAACGASVRNFGMIWPIGQPQGALYQLALESRQLWTEVLAETTCWWRACGSIHLAYRQDELDVLSEFASLAPALGYSCDLVSAESVLRRSPAARRESLLGGLVSETELAVDPREIVAKLPQWLRLRYAAELHFNTSITAVEKGRVHSSAGHWDCDRVVIANGVDFRRLYPELFAAAGFRRCKLQMLRTAPQPAGWSLGPMLAGGLTLRHYANFAICPALEALKERIAAETPELDRYGIHVMASQNGRGEVVLGDSHEYDADITPFDKDQIDALILAELRRMIDLPTWEIHERWHGVYAKAPNLVEFHRKLDDEVFATISSGGAGMTLSMGLAEQWWQAWDVEQEEPLASYMTRPAVSKAQ
jgi:FAD dependent oxidoreductase TIGR03364